MAALLSTEDDIALADLDFGNTRLLGEGQFGVVRHMYMSM
jgi:hypothetical protein